MDSNIEVTTDFVTDTLLRNKCKFTIQTNFKGELIEHCIKKNIQMPKYITIQKAITIRKDTIIKKEMATWDVHDHDPLRSDPINDRRKRP